MDGSSTIKEDNTSILIQLPSLRDTDMSSQHHVLVDYRVGNKIRLNIIFLLPFLQNVLKFWTLLLHIKSFKNRLKKIYHTKYLSTYHNITEINDSQIYCGVWRNSPLFTPKCS